MPTRSPADVSGAAPARKTPLVSATATVLEDPDQDIWVAEGPVQVSAAQSTQIEEIKQKGAAQGDMRGYLAAMTKLGAVKSGSVAVDLNLATRSAGQVRINRIRLDSRCRAPLAGTVFYSPPAGPAMPIGRIGFDLDSAAPTARTLVEHENEQTLGGDYFANKLLYLKKDDGFAYRLVAMTSKRYCEFRILVDASTDGVSQTTTVDDHGRPFRVSGLICAASGPVSCPKFSAYQRVYSGGVANVGNGSWAAKNPKTYDGL